MSNKSHADHPAFSPQWWDHHYQGHPAAHDAPSPQLVAEVTDLAAGTALDAGCGRGTDAVWLARRGWQVTAIDVSPTAVRAAEEFAARQAPEVAPRISWTVADLTVWEPAQQYDLVVSQYVHPDMPFGQFVARLARAVAPGGALLVVGHDHADHHSAAHAPQRASIDLDTVTAALTDAMWEVRVAESRTRLLAPGASRTSFHDVVVRAHRSEPGQPG
ncbi:class I SAM-dependent methyltransferase [Micromonospora phaseoli]|nr:class I SAM-dependent methyltransferase [Micromonospora phaseoli]GIJ76946.1 hypothetical protein Xph01_13780 [Micromonospora phaseoli]